MYIVLISYLANIEWVKKKIERNKDIGGNKMENIIKIIAIIIVFIILTLISALIIWGIGAFIIAVFKINFEWNFLRVLGVSFILMILKNVFSRELEVGFFRDIFSDSSDNIQNKIHKENKKSRN